MKTPPLITVGITCFNAEDTIARAIASAEAQDYPNVEIVVVDDCSADGSVEVIKKIAKRDKRISLHRHKKNSGVAGARNTTISKAKGQYIAFFDDDDEYHPSRISKQYKRLSDFEAKHPNKPILCYANMRALKQGIEIATLHAIGRSSPEPHGTMIADFVLFGKKKRGYVYGFLGTSNLFASKQTLEEFGFDTNFRRCEDWDLAIRVGMAGGYCIAVNEYLVTYYLNEAPDKSTAVALDNNLKLIRKHKEYLQKKNTYWGAIFFNYGRVLYWHGNLVKSCFYLLLACLVSPKVMVNIIMKLPTIIARDLK